MVETSGSDHLEAAVARAYPQFEVSRVSSATEAQSFARRHSHRVRMVMLDLMLPDAEGFSALIQLQQILPESRFAIISARVDHHMISMARSFNADAYLSKAEPVETLVNAVGGVMRGEKRFPDGVIPNAQNGDFHQRLLTLSKAQMRVLKEMSAGKLNKQIAGELGVSEGTVKQHVSAIFKKLGTQNRSQTVLMSARYLGRIV